MSNDEPNDAIEPGPAETSDPKTADGDLTPEMKQRVAALQAARQILGTQSALFSKVPGPEYGVQDLLDVSDYVLRQGPYVPVPDRNYFEAGWEALRSQLLELAAEQSAYAAVEWARERPGKGRLIDGPDLLATPSESLGVIPDYTTPALVDTKADPDLGYPEDALPR